MASIAPPSRPSRTDIALIAVPALLVMAFAVFLLPTVFADGDTNGQVAVGQWILAHRAVPTVDPFSYTNAGRPWVAHEWLADALLALSYRLAGWSGVLVLTGAAAGATFALLAAELRRSLGVLSVIFALGMAMTLLLVHILARPHIIALPLLVLWTTQLMSARRSGRVPPLWLLPVMAFWANLHGSYVFGLAFTGFFALEALLDAKGARVGVALKWGAFGLAAIVMALLTPNGLAGLVHPIEVMGLKGLPWIAEWQPANFAKPTTLELVLLVGLFVCLYRGVKIPAVRLCLLLLLVHMTLQHLRQEIVLAVIGPLLLAEPLGRILEPQRLAAPDAGPIRWREVAPPAALAAAAFIGLCLWRVASPTIRVDSATVPVTALAHVPDELRSRPVFNDYSFGGWMIFKGIRPFIDGRVDMYGDDFFRLYLVVSQAQPGVYEPVFRQYGVVWTILQPSSPLVARLDATPGWRRLYSDKWAVVHARTDALAASATPAAIGPRS